ncbi:MAG: 50S ribosomal protein L24 [Candidatus Ancillula sp.]|jgi:large subunit ribosomal protein L24|nr:50S ribosomal protein L24 [Candidatus Ancillula sp.]
MAKIHKEDQVVVLSGRDKGKSGRVLELIKDKKTRKVTHAIVEHINELTKHSRLQQNNGRQGTTGGIETVEGKIAISAIALKDPATGVATRVGYRDEVKEVSGVKKLKRVRIAKKSGKDA